MVNAKNLRNFYALRNKLTALPYSFFGLTQLTTLEISQNWIAGEIPRDFSGLISLRQVSLYIAAYMYMCGSL